MSVRGCVVVAGVESSKLLGQLKVRAALATCAVGPIAFAVAMRLQSNVPSDTLFGRWVNDSGFALPLVVLGFAGLWLFPVLASIVGGDIFSEEDRYGTWTTVLTRSRSRGEIFAGKTLTALGFSAVVVAVLAASSIASGALVIGRQPLVNLSGVVLEPADAAVAVGLSWLSILLPVLGFTAFAVIVSIATQSSAAGIGLPVVIALMLQLAGFMDFPALIRPLLMTPGFEAWHGLMTDPPYYEPLLYGSTISLASMAVCLLMAYRLLARRDIGR